MTPSQFLQLLPLMREMFPQPIIQEWSQQDYDRAMQQQVAATLAGLDSWREQSAKMENGRS